MQVAHFVQRYPPALGGSEAYFARLSRYLAKAGDEVTVFTTNALDLESFWSRRGRCLEESTQLEDGVDVRRYALARWRGRRYLLKALSLWPSRRWQCLTLPCNPIALRMWSDAGRAERAVDVVHATAFPYAWPIVCGLRLARRSGAPFVLTPFLHLGDPENPRDQTRRAYLSRALLWLLRTADLIFVQTGVEKAALLNQGIPASKLRLLGLGVDAAECTGGQRERIRQACGVRANDLVMGHLANNSEEKGTVDLLRATLQLWESGKDFRLFLAGPEMPNFQRFWRKYPRQAQVHRLGVLDEEQKRDFFAGIDVFALPSRSDSFGLVLLEAWANGVPNVAYRAGGIADIIRHREDGLLVPCGDVSALAETLAQLIKDARLRQHLGNAGRKRTLAEFQWTDKLHRVREVYGELVLQRQSAQG